MQTEVCGLDPDGSGPQHPILKDVLQNDLAISGHKTVPMLVGPTGGKRAMEATATFQLHWVLVVARWRKTAGACSFTWHKTVCVWRVMCWSARRDLDTWRL